MFHILNSRLEDELLCSRNTNEHAVAKFHVDGNETDDFVRYNSIIFQWTREHK